MGESDPVGVIVTGPTTPYVNAEILMSAPTGIAWSTIGSSCGKPTQAQQLAEVTNICARASAMVDSICNSTLRATLDSEIMTGPGDFRFQIQPSGRARMVMSRLPILSVVGGQWCPAGTFPPNWTTIAANMFRVERPVIGTYGTTAPNGSGDGGQSILLAPGIVGWGFGRSAYDVEVFYINGWPHSSLSVEAVTGDTTISVDDITGWLGATGVVYSSSGQETIQATAVTPTTPNAISGPGVLTLAGPLVYQHVKGTIVSTLSGTVQQATILLCVSQALIRGATATTVQALPGSRSSSGARGPDDLIAEAKQMLAPYKRVI